MKYTEQFNKKEISKEETIDLFEALRLGAKKSYAVDKAKKYEKILKDMKND